MICPNPYEAVSRPMKLVASEGHAAHLLHGEEGDGGEGQPEQQTACGEADQAGAHEACGHTGRL